MAQERKDHVMQALRADHVDLIATNPGGATAKFDKIAGAAFVFFRGTPGLFYRDLEGKDKRLPSVLCNGDVHPENLGVLEDADRKLLFGITDFDEACWAPFAWDLKRAATGFELASRQIGLSAKQRRKVARNLVRGYVDALGEYLDSDKENVHRLDEDTAPPLVRKLLRRAARRDRASFLARRIDLDTQQFLKTPEIHPLPELKERFEAAMDEYRKSLHRSRWARRRSLRVLDVAVKTGSGTNSLGMRRYWVLIRGPSRKPEGDIILELKLLTRSALEPYVRSRDTNDLSPQERVVQAREIQAAGGDRFYGYTEVDGKPYLVRERGPHKAAIDWARLDAKQMAEYAGIAGAVIAQAHARADEAASDPERAERKILEAIDRDTLPDEIAGFASEAADQVELDYKAFLELHEAEQFTFPEAPANP